MNDECLASRWYDKDPKMLEVLDIMQSLPNQDQEELGSTLIQLVNLVRKNRKEDDIPISIGKNRALGLYKSFNKRRWYDQNSVLMSAMNTISTLPLEDCRKISEGLLITLDPV